MIDLENLKESILFDLLWTERELKETVRQAINRITHKMTFDYDQAQVDTIGDCVRLSQVDTRQIRLKAIISCPGPNQPEVFQAIRQNLDGFHIAMNFDNTSNEQMMKIVFEVPRWRPFDSEPAMCMEMDDYSVKSEVERILGLDIEPGDKLRRINLPDGWPEEVLTVIGYEFHEKGGPSLSVTGEIKSGTFTIETKNIGVLYEKVLGSK